MTDTIIYTESKISPNVDETFELFIDAVKANNFELVKKFISDGLIDPNMSDDDGIPLLHCYIYNCNIDAAKFLIKECGADPNITDNNKNITPLCIAMVKRNLEFAKWLIIEGKADPNLSTAQYIPLFYALVGVKDLEFVKWLILEGGADVNTLNRYGSTILWVAINNSDLEFIKWLVEVARADIYITDNFGVCPSQFARQFSDKKHIKDWLIRVDYRISERNYNERLAKLGIV